MKKPTQKQIRSQQAKRQHKKQPASRRQAELRAHDELWHDMRPVLVEHNLRAVTDDAWAAFAATVMHDSVALYDEPEFGDLRFHPAEAFYALLDAFKAHAPSPDEFEKLSEDEKAEHQTEAYIQVIAEFVSPEFQRAVLDGLVQCRKRLKREKRADTLALAAAAEMILRGDSEPVVWGTCGMFFRALQASLDEAQEFEAARDEALKAVQAIQPGLMDESELEEGSPADVAFWEAVDKTPGLDEYLEARWELEEEHFDERSELDADVAFQLFDPGELDAMLGDLVESMKAQGIDVFAPDDVPKDARSVVDILPEFVKTHVSPDRFIEFVQDLNDLIADEPEDEDDPRIRRAEELRDDLADRQAPYWQNAAFQQFLFGALVAYVSEEADEFDEQDDGDDEDAF